MTEDIKELKKWREYYKNQWLKTGRDVYKKKHVELEKQIRAREDPGFTLKDIYAASEVVDTSVSDLKSPIKMVGGVKGQIGMTGDVYPNMKMGKHKILSVEENSQPLELIDGLKIDIPVDKKTYISIDGAGITSEHELEEIVSAYIKRYDEITIELPHGHRIYKGDGQGGILMVEEDIGGTVFKRKPK